MGESREGRAKVEVVCAQLIDAGMLVSDLEIKRLKLTRSLGLNREILVKSNLCMVVVNCALEQQLVHFARIPEH